MLNPKSVNGWFDILGLLGSFIFILLVCAFIMVSEDCRVNTTLCKETKLQTRDNQREILRKRSFSILLKNARSMGVQDAGR